MDEIPNCVVPSWWGRLPLPPVQPRYFVRRFAGFTTGGGGGRWERAMRKPRVTWHVYDRLNQGRQVGPDHTTRGLARHAKDALEHEWDRHLEELGSHASTQA